MIHSLELEEIEILGPIDILLGFHMTVLEQGIVLIVVAFLDHACVTDASIEIRQIVLATRPRPATIAYCNVFGGFLEIAFAAAITFFEIVAAITHCAARFILVAIHPDEIYIPADNGTHGSLG